MQSIGQSRLNVPSRPRCCHYADRRRVKTGDRKTLTNPSWPIHSLPTLTATVDNIYLLDKEGRYRYVSLGGARVLGLEPEQMTGKRWQELGLPADIMERFDAQRERALDTGEPQRQRTGGSHHYEYSIAPVRGENGSFEAVVVVSRDDTERKRAEEALREASATLRSFYDTAPVMMGVVEVRGEDVLHLTDNAATARFFGTDPASLAGRMASELGVPLDHLREWVHHYRESERTGQPARFEYQHETPNGRRWLSAIVYCIESLPGNRCRCSYVAEDVTERKRVEQAMRAADRRKDEFLATLAHELRNPLAPVSNALQILKMPRVDAATIERSRDMMERQVHHLVRLVDDLLDMSRVMRGKIALRRERVELATVVARAVETVQPVVDTQHHELIVLLPSESLLLDADPVRLTQVFGNLLTNAAKYTERGGRIHLTAERDGDMATIRVRDNGIGIAPDMLPHVFELFVQADHAATKTQGGLGIGLTLVKNLVELHGGTVKAQSDGLGKGCEFVVRLPLMVQGL
ncbi:MAG TPA: ATP-binding protein, partial [Gemmata sp.]|nr:ATP-binding protein [Gemmata sp.]